MPDSFLFFYGYFAFINFKTRVMAKKIHNNFNAFEQDFKRDTGLDKKTNIEAYINYVNARLNDQNMQLNHFIYGELINLPKAIAHYIHMK
ncbi:hypothetical protein D2V93_02220 [Flagellimonas taeanensis]|nr:hypothetical protein D2V93_07015 [Allomuricauda taeanensis]RIV53621.1 hypothetical protein D2V93_02220 [Allomuricauda taeanensis]